MMEAMLSPGLPERVDPTDRGRLAAGRVPSREIKPQQSCCVVKNTFIEIVSDGQPDMYDEPPTDSRRRQMSEPPLGRHEPDYDRQRNEAYGQRLQAGQADFAKAAATWLASRIAGSEVADASKAAVATGPVRMCPSEDSLVSTHQSPDGSAPEPEVCSSPDGHSTQQYSGADVRSAADEQDLEDFAYHQIWMQGFLATPHMMHPGVAMHAEDESTPCTAESQGVFHMEQGDRKWMPQGTNRERGRRQRSDPMHWDDGVVTVMVRQVPRRYTQLTFLKEVVCSGFEGLFDFLYLPYDLKKGINVGYGFINFITHQHALEFRKAFDGSFLDKSTRLRAKPLRVHPASVQGYEANFRHFVQTKTGQKQDPQFSPLFFPKDPIAEMVSGIGVPPVPWACHGQVGQAAPEYFGAAGPMDLMMTEAKEPDKGGKPPLDEESPGLACSACGAPYRAEHGFCANCGECLRAERPAASSKAAGTPQQQQQRAAASRRHGGSH